MKIVLAGWRDRTISSHSLTVFAEIFLSQSKDAEFLVLGRTPLIPRPPFAANLWLCVGLRVKIWLRFRFICTKTHWRLGLMNINILNDKEKICFMGPQIGSVSMLLLQNHKKIAPVLHMFGLPVLKVQAPASEEAPQIRASFLGTSVKVSQD